MKKTNIIIIAFIILILAFIAAGLIVAFRKPKVSEQARITIPPVKVFSKGQVSFSYPREWEIKDIPTIEGLISVQVFDPKENVVFVASSNNKFSDSEVKGDLRYEKELALGGVQGKERLWESKEMQSAIFRADEFEFQKRHYRFEMFSALSRRLLAEQRWREILASVKFQESSEEGIKAEPAGTMN